MFAPFPGPRRQKRSVWLFSALLHAGVIGLLFIFHATGLPVPSRHLDSIFIVLPRMDPVGSPPLLPHRPMPREFTPPEIKQPEPSQPSLIETFPTQIVNPPMLATPTPIPIPPLARQAVAAPASLPAKVGAAETGQFQLPIPKQSVPHPLLVALDAGFGVQSGNETIQSQSKPIASNGAFDRVPAASMGRAVGRVSSGGFDSSSAGLTGTSQISRQPALAGFGGPTLSATRPKVAAPAAASRDDTSPLEITFKPKPAYSDEARRLQLEGESVIEAIFTASGEVRVIRIIRGLGHGLDETAIAAIRAIRFIPARQHGRSIDSIATVRMIFELAY